MNQNLNPAATPPSKPLRSEESEANPPIAVDRIREEFPFLERDFSGTSVVYLDNAATTQKPLTVIRAIDDFYRRHNANVHRGVYRLSQEATELYEGAREKIRGLIGAEKTQEIIFVRGATEAINLVAHSFVRPRLTAGDEVLVSTMEHHSNIVPWQLVANEIGARIRVIPINDHGEINLEAFSELISAKTKLVAIASLSNALGTINPVAAITDLAHRMGVPVLVDAAQSASHEPLDVQALGVDFLAISGHKMYGPTGIGALYGKESHLQEMIPYQGGGDMIRTVSFEETTYSEPPSKFEAGTPNIAGAIGLGAAVDFLTDLGLEGIRAHEAKVLGYAHDRLGQIPGIRFIGTAKKKASIISFVIDGIHPHDLGTILDTENVAIRTGHHCAQPTMEHFGVPATARASIGCYNTTDEIDRLTDGIRKALEVFR